MVMSAEYKSKFEAFTSNSDVSMWVKNGTWIQNKQTKTLNFSYSQVTDCWIVHCSLSYQKTVSAPLQKKIKGRLNIHYNAHRILKYYIEKHVNALAKGMATFSLCKSIVRYLHIV